MKSMYLRDIRSPALVLEPRELDATVHAAAIQQVSRQLGWRLDATTYGENSARRRPAAGTPFTRRVVRARRTLCDRDGLAVNVGSIANDVAIDRPLHIEDREEERHEPRQLHLLDEHRPGRRVRRCVFFDHVFDPERLD